MKKLNITKEAFEKSNYFQKKYGKLEFVSESGKLFKTDKGRILKFSEASKSTYDGAPNALDDLVKKLDSATEDLEKVAELKKKVASFTLDAINNRKQTKAAMSALKQAEKETQHLVDDAKEFAEYLGMGDEGSMFFAVQDHAIKTGILVAKKAKVASQDDSYNKILEKITSPDIADAYPQLKEVGESVKSMLESARQMIIDFHLFDQPKKDITSTTNIYDQDEKGKMKKVSEGLGDTMRGAWRKVKSGFAKFCSWFTETFFPKYQVKEERYLQELDSWLSKVDAAFA